VGADPGLHLVLSAGPRDSRVTVRLATPADAASLARLRYSFRAAQATTIESEHDFLARCGAWMAERLGPKGAWRCWVAETGNHLVGTIWLQLIEKLPNPVEETEWHGYITSFYVDPGWRNSGLGSAMLARALEECAAREVDAVILWPTPKSRALYERHGFGVRDDIMARR
jgi:GNAT superfamily N-acetyltransferase